jgi:hypothetical protein
MNPKNQWSSGILLFLLALIPIVTPGCGGEKMPKYSILQSLRVIGLQLQPPEVNFDVTTGFTTPAATTSVSLVPVISDLYGGGRSLTYHLYHCVDPGIGTGAIPTCTGNPTRTAVQTGQVVTPPSAGFLSPNFTGSLAAVPIDLSSGTLGAGVMALYAAKFQGLTAAQKFNGFSILVFFEIFPTGDESKKITTFKRLIVSGSAKAVKNLNPSALTFLSGGTDLGTTQTFPSVKSPVNAFVDAIDFENYLVMDAAGNTGSAIESIETTWFFTGPEDVTCSKDKECTSDGLFSLSRSKPGELNVFTPPVVSTPSTRGRVLIGVAKDNRGGSTVTRICDNNGFASNCP